MTPLPPVRKRTSYADIKPDDLVMALFTDRVVGSGALDPDKAPKEETPPAPKVERGKPKAQKLAKRAPSPLSAYAPISKADEGERLVYGVASTSIVDDQPGVWEGRRYDGDLVEPAAMREALASYWGNLRAMHEGAAGRALDVTVADDGNTYLVAKVTDDDAWRSVRERVYQGFSIGGRVLKAHLERVGGRLVRRITKLLLTEISLVDRPANPQAAILVYKRHPQGGDMDENETITTPPGEGGAALDALADLAGDDVLEKASDPRKAIGLIQQLRNDAELEGDLEAAERYTQAIGLLLIASGGADAGDIDEDLAEEEEEAGVDLEALGAEGEGKEEPAEAAKVLKSGRKIAASRMALLKSALMTYAKALADAGDEDAAKMLKALAPGDEPAADAETMKALVADELKKALGPADSSLQTVARAVLNLFDELKKVAADVKMIAAQPVGGGPAIRLAPALVQKRLGAEDAVTKRAEDDPTKRRAIYQLEQRLATENNPTTRAQYQAELRKLLGE